MATVLACSGFGDDPMVFIDDTGAVITVPNMPVEPGVGTDAIITLPISKKVAVCAGNSPHFPTWENGVFSADFAAATEADTESILSSIAADASDNYYGLSFTGTGTGDDIRKYSANAILQATWSLTAIYGGGPGHSKVLAVNPAGTRAYTGTFAGDATFSSKIHEWDISGGGSHIGVFTTETGYWPRTTSAMLCLSTGDVLVGWQVRTASGPGYVKHYDSSGSLLYTYPLPDSGGVAAPLCIRESLTPGRIWVNYYSGDSTNAGGSAFVEIELVTGTVTAGPLYPVAPGSGVGGEFEFDSSFAVVDLDVVVTLAEPWNPDDKTIHLGPRDDQVIIGNLDDPQATLHPTPGDLLVSTDDGDWQRRLALGGLVKLSNILNRAGPLDIVNVSTEQTLYTFSVPANVLALDRAVHLQLEASYLNNSASSRTLTIKVKFGATTVYADTLTFAAAATRSAVRVDVVLGNLGAANAQWASLRYEHGHTTAPATGTSSIASGALLIGAGAGSATEDSTSAQTFAVTVQHSTAHANLSITRKLATLQLR